MTTSRSYEHRAGRRPANTTPRNKGTGAPEAVWATLQSSIGNAAVGRLMAASERASSEDVTPIDAGTQSAIDSQRSTGRSLEPALKQDMEDTLGVELPEVRLHLGREADALTRRLSARGVTQGHDVFLRSDRDPSSEEGRATLAHELTHAAEGRTEHPVAGVQRDPDTDLLNQAKITGGAALSGVGQSVTSLGGTVSALPGMGTLGSGMMAVGQGATMAGSNLTMSGMGGMIGNLFGPGGPMAPQPANPGMQAMWDVSVTNNVNAAIEALKKDQPDPQLALEKVSNATPTMKALVDSYRSQGKDSLADSISIALNAMVGIRLGLEPHVGKKQEIKTLSDMLEMRLSRLSEIRGQLT